MLTDTLLGRNKNTIHFSLKLCVLFDVIMRLNQTAEAPISQFDEYLGYCSLRCGPVKVRLCTLSLAGFSIAKLHYKQAKLECSIFHFFDLSKLFSLPLNAGCFETFLDQNYRVYAFVLRRT